MNKRIILNAEPILDQKAGVGRVAFEVIKKLSEKINIEDELILFTSQRITELNTIKQIVIPNYPKIIGFSSLRLFFLFPFYALLIRANFFIEFTHFGPFNLTKGIKRITYIHDLTPISHSHLHTFMGSFLQKLFLKSIIDKAHLIVTNSANTTNDLHRLYPKSIGKSIKNYLGVSNIIKPDYTYNAIDKFSVSKKYFLFVGTIEPRKKIEVLLESFGKLCSSEDENFNLVIVGKLGWKYHDIINKINNHRYRKLIICTGYVSNEYLNQLYTHSICLIYPSEYEGFGLPVIEAYKCNTLSIVADNSSLLEIGKLCGSIFFKTNDSESLMIKMKIMLSYTDYLLNSENYFSWDNHTDKLLEYICKLN